MTVPPKAQGTNECSKSSHKSCSPPIWPKYILVIVEQQTSGNLENSRTTRGVAHLLRWRKLGCLMGSMQYWISSEKKIKKLKGWCPYKIRATNSILEKWAENATFDQSPPFWRFPTNSAITHHFGVLQEGRDHGGVREIDLYRLGLPCKKQGYM
jgi:hypothetical protein